MEHFDVVIVGAGLSGIGAARHLQDKCPGRSYTILEGRANMGGTWDLFRYPGIRSDSDMHTLGYNFKPWIDKKSIAEGPAIRRYIKETAAENGIDKHIRYQQLVQKADWSGEKSRWTLSVAHAETGESKELSCNFLLMCSGYYSYKQAHNPEFEGKEDFQGQIIHPQFWPKDLDYKGKKIVVIGSGATAVTLVPAMADTTTHVTMLQRSPTYMASRAWEDRIANLLRKIMPDAWAYAITRWKNTSIQQFFYRRTRTHPEQVKKIILDRVRKAMGPDYDIKTHFTPRYNPWDQRVCLVPDGDFFESVKSGDADIVTDEIDRFTTGGILLKSGKSLNADIIITATGLELVVMGEIEFSVDGQAINFADQWTYKGLMVTGVPNCVSTFGYINASWTLRADITAEWTCRLLNHMDEKQVSQAVPVMPADLEQTMPHKPWIDNFSSGYMQRAMPFFPKQGDQEPWINPQDYKRDKAMFRRGDLDDGSLQFSGAHTTPELTLDETLSAA